MATLVIKMRNSTVIDDKKCKVVSLSGYRKACTASYSNRVAA